MNQFRRMMMQGTPPADVPDIDWEDLPHESIVFEFPLYLNITDFSYEDEWCVYYERTPDEVSQQLYQWLEQTIGIMSPGDVKLLTESVYFNGGLAITAGSEGLSYLLEGDFEHFDEVFVYFDGIVEGVKYK